MDSWNSDLVLNVVQFLNATDSARLACTASRYYYLVHHYRRLRGPELVASSSQEPGVTTRQRTNQDLYHDAFGRMQAPPNLIQAFTSPTSTLMEELPALAPRDCVLLGVSSVNVQSCIDGALDYKGTAGLMLASLTQAKMHPFLIRDSLDSLEATFPEEHYPVIFLYACGEGRNILSTLVTDLQNMFPRTTLVGGICTGGHISIPIDPSRLAARSNYEHMATIRALGGEPPKNSIDKNVLKDYIQKLAAERVYHLHSLDESDGGVFGVALSGEVPVRSVVSRGVTSMTYRGSPQPTTSFFIEEADYCQPGDEGYMFRGENPYHLVRKIRDENTGRSYTAKDFLNLYGTPDFVGLRRPDHDGFRLETPHPLSLSLSGLLFFLDDETSPLTDSNLDLFAIDSDACVQDVEMTMDRLRAQTEDEELLGAIMVSCGARGPSENSMLGKPMVDAKSFVRVFPDIPCLGFYAGGEVGPMALAGRQSVFRSGSAALQGFTVVFAVIVVPKVDLGAIALDDSRENIQDFLKERFPQVNGMATSN